MSEYRPDEPSPLPQANAYVAYRKGRLDGLDGRPFEPIGATVEELSAYRKGYGHGEEERGPSWLVVLAAGIGVVVIITVVAIAAQWWFR